VAVPAGTVAVEVFAGGRVDVATVVSVGGTVETTVFVGVPVAVPVGKPVGVSVGVLVGRSVLEGSGVDV